MYWKAFLHKNIIFLLLVSFISYPEATTTTTTTTTAASTTKKYRGRHGYKRKYKSRYYGNMDGYYGGDDNYYEKTGDDGIDPRRLGQDIGDFGPVYEYQRPMNASMDIFIRSADDWESDLRYKGRGRNNYGRDNYRGDNYRGDNYRGDDYDGDNYRGNKYRDDKPYRGGKKRSYSRMKFPVRHYPDVKKFPRHRLPPLVSIFPWLPIFYDKITYQTIIFSPTGGLYIIPPLINFYGKRFAVAQLIKWGYASLVSSGVPPPAGVNVAPLVAPGPGSAPAVGFDNNKIQFTDGVKSNHRDFKPRYSDTIDEGGRDYRPSSYGNSYSSNSNYGGPQRGGY